MKITITADVVAWYAAIVATFALAVNAYLARRDRAHLTVTALSGFHVTPGVHPYSLDKLYISVTVANRGLSSTCSTADLTVAVLATRASLMAGDFLTHCSWISEVG